MSSSLLFVHFAPNAVDISKSTSESGSISILKSLIETVVPIVYYLRTVVDLIKGSFDFLSFQPYNICSHLIAYFVYRKVGYICIRNIVLNSPEVYMRKWCLITDVIIPPTPMN